MGKRCALMIVSMIGLGLQGCAEPTPRPITGPNARQAYVMKCSGVVLTPGECYKKAAGFCPAGYDIVERATAPTYNLIVECK
jgi:hypothetical protein